MYETTTFEFLIGSARDVMYTRALTKMSAAAKVYLLAYNGFLVLGYSTAASSDYF